MSSTHKTFQTGEILSADDVNNALNPDTADHIARAITAGVTTIRTNSSPGTAQVVPSPCHLAGSASLPSSSHQWRRQPVVPRRSFRAATT